MNISPGTRPQRSYLFIDAGSLKQAFDDFRQYYDCDIDLSINLEAIRETHAKVYYYDAIPVQTPGEPDVDYLARVAPKRSQLAAIDRLQRFHVRTGDVRKRKGKGNEQKMVDVHLAVDALTMASRGLFASATFITSDLDFRPLILALVEMGIDVTLQYRPNATNAELIAAADIGIPLTDRVLLGWIDHSSTPFSIPLPYHDFVWNDCKRGR